MVKDKVTVSIDRALLKEIDAIVERHSHMGSSRSAVMEYYLKKGIAEDRRKLQEEEIGRSARVLR